MSLIVKIIADHTKEHIIFMKFQVQIKINIDMGQRFGHICYTCTKYCTSKHIRTLKLVSSMFILDI